ncbi:MAG: hypothetical protein HZC02_05025 [Candidatus Levybacteria bacterium]|nr:hypothetical protein [Candidatus Levybacteria bacterium]
MPTKHYEIRDNEGGFIDSFSVTRYEAPSADGIIEWVLTFCFTFAIWLFILSLKLVWKGFLPLLWISIKNLWGFGIFVAIGSIYVEKFDPTLSSYMLKGGLGFTLLVLMLRATYQLALIREAR